MGRMARVSLLTLVVGIAPCVTGDETANAQQPAIKRTELLKTDLAGMEGKEMNLWTADLAPGAHRSGFHTGWTQTGHSARSCDRRKMRSAMSRRLEWGSIGVSTNFSDIFAKTKRPAFLPA